MPDPIYVPRSRMWRILHVLNINPSDQVIDILLTQEGGIMTRYALDDRGNTVRKNDEPVTEQVDIVFSDEIDPRASGPQSDRE